MAEEIQESNEEKEISPEHEFKNEIAQFESELKYWQEQFTIAQTNINRVMGALIYARNKLAKLQKKNEE